MRAGAAVAVGAAGLVAAAAVATGIRGAIRHDDAAPAAAETAATASTATTTAAPPAAVPGTTAPTLPVGDLRRLPKPRAGDLDGTLLIYSAGLCYPIIVDLARLVSTSNSRIGACNEWVSPGGRQVALTLPPPENGELRTETPLQASPPRDTGLPYVPGEAAAVTVTDDGTVAICDGRHVLVARHGRVRTARTLTPAAAGFDERCVTGAIGAEVVQLADDRRRLVDAVSGATVRRLAAPVRQPVAAIASSSDGDVLVADTVDGILQGTVYGPDGSVLISRRPVGRAHTVRKAELARGGTVVALQTEHGWDITSLANSHTLAFTPGGFQALDVAFAPDGHAVAAATVHGVVFATLPDLTPRWLIQLPAQGVGWFPAALFPDLRTAPVSSDGTTAIRPTPF